MTATPDDPVSPPRWSRPGFNLGLRLALPVLPGLVAFGLAVGATAARKGLGFIDHMLMNVFVYAGMSQLVVMEVWPDRITIATLAGLALICATVNARLLLMTAALQPWLGPLPNRQIYPALHLLIDPGWLIAMRYRADGGSDIGLFFGSGVLLFVAWQCAVAAGYFLGGLIADPRQIGLDLVMPVFFAAMLIPLWNGPRRGLTWAAVGAVALIVQHFIGGWWFIVAGASRAACSEASSMIPNSGEWGMLAAILAMALATYAMRAGGFWLMGHVPLTRRVRRMLEALPGSVVVATVLPIVVRDGIAAALAIGAAVAVMAIRRNDLLAVITGMAVAGAIRAVGW